MAVSVDWISVKKDLPDKNADARDISYLVTVEYDNGRFVTVADWGPVSNYRREKIENDDNYSKFIHDGWAFGYVWDDKIETVYRVIAWSYLPRPYLE